jgi:uncharacterized circularly permuted ATP-grasp superfamily protein/uncharacterized alpha-E superfamily protein
VSAAFGAFAGAHGDDASGRAVTAYGEQARGLDGVDELITSGGPSGLAEVGAQGDVRPASADLAATIDLLGLPGLLARRAETARLVEDEGVTYSAPRWADEHSDDGVALRGASHWWKLDPVPVVLDTLEWQALEPAIAQRVELLDLILTDLYGPRELLRRGVIPAEVVLGHSEFLRAADQIRLPGRHQLFLAAVDLGRDRDGAWTVIGDRTQAPSGAGYAMENRRIVSRVMPGLYRGTRLERLRSFFHTVREGLQEIAPATAEAPRVVMLTPGPGSETAFDQSFLSTLLGFPVVSGEDLTVREGRVHVRAPGRLEPVDVVLRRVDAWFSDPLELRPESRLGVPGLLEAARRGTVSVVNTFGAGVLENPGLLPFLPMACQALLGETLRLPSAQTWWCGDALSRAHVLAHLDRMVVKPISRGEGRTSAFGWELSQARREGLRRRIEAAPHAWCAQEPVALSTAPVVTPGGLEPRRFLLRAFAVAKDGGYRLMTGGLGRVSARPDSVLVSSAAGSLAKDVWVLSAQAAVAWSPPSAPDVGPVPQVGEAVPSTRAAEDLFWLGRYAERTEDAVRLLRVLDDLAEDWTSRPGTPGNLSLRILLETVTVVTTTFPGFTGPGAAALLDDPRRELLALVVDADRPGTLAHGVARTVEAAHAVRDQLSLDTWVVLGSLERVLGEMREAAADGVEQPLQPPLARMLEGLLALAGLGAESMVRDVGWYFMDAGRRLERALQVAALLRNAIAPSGGPPVATAVEALVLESVLIAGESIITYRRRHQGRPQLAGVADLLLADRHNPRSVAHQLDRFADDLVHLPPEAAAAVAAGAGLQGSASRDRLAAVQARLREVDTTDAGRFAAALGDLHSALSDLAATFARVHFVHTAPQRPLAGSPGWLP